VEREDEAGGGVREAMQVAEALAAHAEDLAKGTCKTR
jgi:hypothetical protein